VHAASNLRRPRYPARLVFEAQARTRLLRDLFPGYTTAEQAADYPEGRYKLRLQTSAEAGDQAELDALLGRRSWGEMWRLGVTLLVIFVGLVVASRVLLPSRPVATEARGRQATIIAGVVGAADPLRTLTTYRAAQETLKELDAWRGERGSLSQPVLRPQAHAAPFKPGNAGQAGGGGCQAAGPQRQPCRCTALGVRAWGSGAYELRRGSQRHGATHFKAGAGRGGTFDGGGAG
jgi:hypothetical protein